MCGICGVINYPDSTYNELIGRMVDVLKHRGPDDFGIEIFQEDRVALARQD